MLFNVIMFTLYFLINISYSAKQCCIDPVQAFRIKEWHGPCACQLLHEKWERYNDWIQLNGGYIHPDIIFKHINDDVTNRGIFSISSNIIQPSTILMQIPFSISLTQFLISSYIPNNKNQYNHSQIFGDFDSVTNINLLPPQFPDFDEFLLKYSQHHKKYNGENNLLSSSITLWLALGISWISVYTNELLPWLSLLPSPYYLPFLFQDKEYLFKGTQVEIILHAMEYEFSFALSYLNILGVSQQLVREMYALLHSRLFSIDFSHFGGLTNSVAIPCGADFFNHDSSIKQHDFPFYDELFGHNYYSKTKLNTTQHSMSDIIPKMVKSIGKSNVKPIDFMSTYYFVKYAIYPKTEIFGSYGTIYNHPTHISMAIYGFFDVGQVHEKDYINLMFVNYNDKGYQYFDENKKLGLKFGFWYKHLYFTKKDPMSRDLQLMYLTPKYLDSFTVSCILNGFEWKYLKTIRPIIERGIRSFCYDKLMYFYPTKLMQDYKTLRLIKQYIKYINKQIKNVDRNVKEKWRLQDILMQAKQQLTITKYTIREKAFYVKCRNIEIVYE